jgi:hypothetical protein
MKNVVIVAMAIATAILLTEVQAVDVSSKTSREQSIKKDKSMSVKTGSEKRSSNRKFNTSTNAKGYSADMTFDVVAIYSHFADECFRELTPAADFGLRFEDNGIIDLNRKAYFENAASGAMKLSKIDGVDEHGIKRMIGCKIYNSGRMAQANLILQKSIGGKTFSSRDIVVRARDAWENAAHPTDSFIVSQLQKAETALKSDCRFVPNLGKDSIQCGSLMYSFADGSVKNAGVALSSGEKFFGVHSSLRVSLSDTDTVGRETARENSQSSARDASLIQTGSNSMNHGSEQQLNVAPFIPR